jgi:dTMP kinase
MGARRAVHLPLVVKCMMDIEKAKRKGCFVTFEGIEGSGKTTQIKMAGAFLESQGIHTLITEEPGGTALGKKLRNLLLNRSAFNISKESELLLFLSDRAQHVREVILPALRVKQWVLCDRFSDATIAYQGFGRGLDRHFVKQVTNFAADALVPDRTLLFDLPVEQGLKRALQRASKVKNAHAEDRFERETLQFHEKVRAGYLALSNEEPQRIRVIDGRPVKTDVCREVSLCLVELIRSWKHD